VVESFDESGYVGVIQATVKRELITFDPDPEKGLPMHMQTNKRSKTMDNSSKRCRGVQVYETYDRPNKATEASVRLEG
jgi:hypothetical protein